MERSGGDIPTLVRQLRSTSRAAQLTAVQSLGRHAIKVSARNAIVAAGGPAALVPLLRSASEALQLEAVRALGHVGLPGRADTATGRAAIQAIEGLAGAPLATFAAARSDAQADGGAQGRAAAVGAAGGILALVECLQRSSQHVRAAAAEALSHLMLADSKQQQAIVAAGAVPPLVQLLGSSDENAQRVSAATLFHVAAVGGVQSEAAIAAAGAVPRLVRLLDSCGIAWSQQCAVGILYTLVRDSADSAAQFVAAGGAPALVGLLQRSSSSVVLEYSVLVLRIAAENSSSAVPAIVECGGAPLLVWLLASGSAGARHQAAVALAVLTAERTGTTAARAAVAAVPGCVPALLGAAQGCGSSSSECRHAAADVIAAISADPLLGAQAIPDACERGSIRALVQQMGSADDPVEAGAAAAALRNLAESPAAALATAQEGGIQAALRLLPWSDCARRWQRSAALQLLRNLATYQRLGAAVAGTLVASGAAGCLQALQHQGGADSDDQRIASELLHLVALLAEARAATPPAAAAAAAAPPRASLAATAACAAPGCGATARLRRCAGCGVVRYCSEACSRVHWRAHKVECRRLQAAPRAATGAAVQ